MKKFRVIYGQRHWTGADVYFKCAVFCELVTEFRAGNLCVEGVAQTSDLYLYEPSRPLHIVSLNRKVLYEDHR